MTEGDIPDAVAAEFAAAEVDERVTVESTDTPVAALHGPEDWRAEVDLILSILRGALPEWEWPPDQLEVLATGLRELLHRLAPGGLGNLDAWGPWAKIAVGSGMIAMANFDWAARKFRPVRIVHHDKASGRNTDSGHGGQPAGQDTRSDVGHQIPPAPAGVGPEGELVADSPVPLGAGAGGIPS